MQLVMVGLNHRTAPVELRERVTWTEDDLTRVYQQLCQSRTVFENVILSTCNRTEIYGVVASAHGADDYLSKLLSHRAALPIDEMRTHLELLQGEAVIRHIMKVATGLDSLVVGETQILGQVRDAFLLASEAGSAGTILQPLFRAAITLGKRAHTETEIGQNAVSVSYAAVQLTKKIFGSLEGRRVLVVGAGKMSELTTQHLHASGIAEVRVVNRSFERAAELAGRFGGRAVKWSELTQALSTADIVISSTGAPSFVLHRADVEPIVRHRGGRPMVLVDIAVPRDVDPTIGDLGNVYLYDIDDLEGVVAANQAQRAREGVLVERMIDEAYADFVTWLAEQRVVPLIAAIRDKGEQIQAQVMASLERKLPDLSEREQKLIHKHTMSIVNQLLRDPIRNLKELASAPGGADSLLLIGQLFGVVEEAQAQPAVQALLDGQAAHSALATAAASGRSDNQTDTRPAFHPALR